MADAISLTARQLNRATLARQMLLSRQTIDVVGAVRALGALQAQSPPSPSALWNRISDFAATELDRAYADHEIVKATLMRTTLHAVAAADSPSFHHAMVDDLRRARLGDHRFIATGLSVADAEALSPARSRSPPAPERMPSSKDCLTSTRARCRAPARGGRCARSRR